jgi:hypothetical protein
VSDPIKELRGLQVLIEQGGHGYLRELRAELLLWVERVDAAIAQREPPARIDREPDDLERLAAKLSDLGATVEYPGYVAVPCGDCEVVAGQEDDEWVVQVTRDGVCVDAAVCSGTAIDTAAETVRKLHRSWGLLYLRLPTVQVSEPRAVTRSCRKEDLPMKIVVNDSSTFDRLFADLAGMNVRITQTSEAVPDSGTVLGTEGAAIVLQLFVGDDEEVGSGERVLVPYIAIEELEVY